MIVPPATGTASVVIVIVLSTNVAVTVQLAVTAPVVYGLVDTAVPPQPLMPVRR